MSEVEKISDLVPYEVEVLKAIVCCQSLPMEPVSCNAIRHSIECAGFSEGEIGMAYMRLLKRKFIQAVRVDESNINISYSLTADAVNWIFSNEEKLGLASKG